MNTMQELRDALEEYDFRETQGAGGRIAEAVRAFLVEQRARGPAPVAVPAGYALVPVEPTPEMIAAGWFSGEMHLALGHANAYRDCEADYARMLAAAKGKGNG